MSTWKKSAARIVFAWACRNARQVCPARLGAGSMSASLRICHACAVPKLAPLGLGAQEQRPAWPGLPWRGIDTGLLQDLPHVDAATSISQPGQFTVDPAVAPARVLAGQPEDQGPDVPAGGWPAGLASFGPGGPATADDVAVPAQDRVRGDQQPQPVAAAFRHHGKQGRQECPVRPVQVRAARPAAAAGRRADGAGSRSPRSSMSPHAGRAAARRPPCG